ncbi:MAG TPA: GNAT family N-acetyltransferase [Terrimicrobiaceae bacterium]
MAERYVRFRLATKDDIDSLLSLQEDYYREDGYAFHKEKARRAWETLLSDPRLGSAWAAESVDGLVGYVVITLGYSLEYLGKEALIDELYFVPAVRGRGLGREALSLAEAACAQLRVKVLHLEVERSKSGARELYRRSGFVELERVLMTKILPRCQSSGRDFSREV